MDLEEGNPSSGDGGYLTGSKMDIGSVLVDADVDLSFGLSAGVLGANIFPASS